PALPGDFGQEPGKPPNPLLCTVRGRRTAEHRTPREARASTAFTVRPRPPTGPSVIIGSASVDGRPGVPGVPETVTSGRPLPTTAPVTPVAPVTKTRIISLQG